MGSHPQEVRSLPGVSYVEEDALGRVNYDDALSWGTDRVNQKDLPLDNNDDFKYDGEGGNIYIIDTGIRVTHNDFNGRATWAENIVDSNNEDFDGHGTHCAGTAAGTRYGVAKKANVYAVKVCYCAGFCRSSDVVAGVDYVARKKTDGEENVVASMSLTFLMHSQALQGTVTSAIQEGVVVVAASGNQGDDACEVMPANIHGVITVGNTQRNDIMHYSSNYGKCVDILAPGTSITSASHWNDYESAVKTGTSMACAHVAGAAAILMANRGVHPSEVRNILVREATSDRIHGNLADTPNKLLYVEPQDERNREEL
ncbi:aqualysin-1-like [Diadema antillarum]|uniref:aqualysin-1-like n=1 Tax=Diadema antillarum TaxID=105358 RepID=UPI003A86A253